MKGKQLILTVVMILCLLCSCGKEPDANGAAENNRFEIEYSEYDRLKIIRDTETGVKYLFYKMGNGGGLTVLLESTEGGENEF